MTLELYFRIRALDITINRCDEKCSKLVTLSIISDFWHLFDVSELHY